MHGKNQKNCILQAGALSLLKVQGKVHTKHSSQHSSLRRSLSAKKGISKRMNARLSLTHKMHWSCSYTAMHSTSAADPQKLPVAVCALDPRRSCTANKSKAPYAMRASSHTMRLKPNSYRGPPAVEQHSAGWEKAWSVTIAALVKASTTDIKEQLRRP